MTGWYGDWSGDGLLRLRFAEPAPVTLTFRVNEQGWNNAAFKGFFLTILDRQPAKVTATTVDGTTHVFSCAPDATGYKWHIGTGMQCDLPPAAHALLLEAYMTITGEAAHQFAIEDPDNVTIPRVSTKKSNVLTYGELGNNLGKESNMICDPEAIAHCVLRPGDKQFANVEQLAFRASQSKDTELIMEYSDSDNASILIGNKLFGLFSMLVDHKIPTVSVILPKEPPEDQRLVFTTKSGMGPMVPDGTAVTSASVDVLTSGLMQLCGSRIYPAAVIVWRTVLLEYPDGTEPAPNVSNTVAAIEGSFLQGWVVEEDRPATEGDAAALEEGTLTVQMRHFTDPNRLRIAVNLFMKTAEDARQGRVSIVTDGCST